MYYVINVDRIDISKLYATERPNVAAFEYDGCRHYSPVSDLEVATRVERAANGEWITVDPDGEYKSWPLEVLAHSYAMAVAADSVMEGHPPIAPLIA